MDPNLSIPYHTRIHNLRIAIHYSRATFARILGISQYYLDKLESKHKRDRVQPRLAVIKRLRLMERAFREPLAQYYKDVKKWGARETWGKEEKVYLPFDGNNYTMRMKKQYRSRVLLPIRQTDIDALGGIEVFGTRARKRTIEQ